MAEREIYTTQIAGLTRHLPLFEVAPGVRIAIFNMLGDTYVIKAAAAALGEALQNSQADVLITAEAKSIPLAYELSALLGIPFVVLRKTYKSYMGDAIKAETNSITTGDTQTLFLDEKDLPQVRGNYCLLLDDVISTGSTLKGMRQVVAAAGGHISQVAAVFTEGDADWSDVIALGNLPVFVS